MSNEPNPGIWTHRLTNTETPVSPVPVPAGSPANLGAGFSFAVKANIEVAGMPASAASPVFEGYLPQADSPVVAILKRHGGQLAGLTNMHELAFGITSNNAAFGPVRNPFDPQRSAGGSSGGSAAAVAAGLVPVSLGTDTGGSISIPAAACGVVGFRPSTGRWPSAGTIGLSWSRDTIGVHARSVEHVAIVDAWVTHEYPVIHEALHTRATDRPVIGVPTAFRLDLDPAVELRFNEVLAALEDHAEIVDIDLDLVFSLTEAAQWDLVGWEAPRLLAAHLSAAEDLSPSDAWVLVVARAASPDVRGILAAYDANPVDPEAYAAACTLMDAAREHYAALMDSAGIDALVFPTLPCLPPLIGEDQSTMHRGQPVPVFPLMTRHAGPGTVLGTPSVTLPAGLTGDGLPVGITFQGLAHRDRQLLAITAHLESALGT